MVVGCVIIDLVVYVCLCLCFVFFVLMFRKRTGHLSPQMARFSLDDGVTVNTC